MIPQKSKAQVNPLYPAWLELYTIVGKGVGEQTEEQTEIQHEIAPNDEWMRFVEGKLLAFRLVGEHFQEGER